MRINLVVLMLSTALAAAAAKPPAWRPEPGIRFEPNSGQAEAGVKFLTRGHRSSLMLIAAGAQVRLRGAKGAEQLTMQMSGSNPHAEAVGVDRLPSSSNYLLGSDSAKWRTGVANYAKVRYHGVYQGIDLVYYGNGGELEYDFILKPGANPAQVRLRFSGQRGLRIDGEGNLAIRMSAGEVIQKRPRVYQDLGDHRVEISSSYHLRGSSVGFELGTWDREHELVIDPVLSYSTFWGGGSEELAPELAIDSAGNAYLFGDTASSNFTTTNGALRSTRAGGPFDNYITKFGPDGKVVWSTLLGGGGDETAAGIAVDGTGSVYLAGSTSSSDFPVSANAPQKIKGIGGEANTDVFVAKLNAAGSALVYATFLGARGDDTPTDIAINTAGEAFVTGFTFSVTFPTTVGALKTRDDAVLVEGFATRIDPTGSTFVYSTFIGGTFGELINAIAVDFQNNVYVAGTSFSPDFPVTTGAFQTNRQGISDPFVLKLNPQGNAIVYSTLVGGGTGPDTMLDLAIDSAGNAYITGVAESTDFPVGANPIQRTRQGSSDGFLFKLNQSGSSIVYGTYLGGAGGERGESVAVDALGSAYVLLTTGSTSGLTPIQGVQTANAGGNDLYVLKISNDGASVVQSTFLGGASNELGRSIAVDNRDRAYVTASTQSSTMPGTAGSVQPGPGGARDSYWARLDFAAPGVTLSVAPTSLAATGAVGAAIARQQLSLVVAAGQRPDWNLEVTTTSGGTWLEVTPSSGSGAATVDVNFRSTALAAGTYNGTITLVNRTANTRTPVPVTLTITPAGSSGGQLTSAGVLSAASFQGGGVSPGLIVTIFGQRIGPDQLVSAQIGTDLKFPTTVAETRVLFGGVPAPLIYVSAGQLSAIVPYAVAAAANTELAVEFRGVRSTPVSIPVLAAKPGLFTANSSGIGPGAIQNQNLSVNTASNPAQRGSIVVLYATGEGATNPAGVDGQVAASVFPKPIQSVAVRIAGVNAEVLYAGAAPSLVAGVLQINARIPDSVPDGALPIQILVGNTESPGGVTVAVQGNQNNQ